MKKKTLILIALVATVLTGFSQSIADGIKQLSYQRYAVAKQTLQNAYNANSKDPNAIYWLGQVILAEADNSAAGIAAAKAHYQQALTNGVNDPLVWVGIGQTELLEGKPNEARQRFEQAQTTALASRKNQRADVLIAIGRANAAGGSEIGDPNYGIEKLNKAAEIDKMNAEVDILKGILYSKMGTDRGGDAVTSFRAALVKDPNSVIANYRIGNIYYSQRNVAAFEDAYNKASAIDPQFTLGYIKLIQYYENRDINKANQIIQTLIANSPDKGCELDFFQANYLFLSGKYQESLNKATAMQANCATYPYLNSLFAYNYDRLGDSVNAKKYIEQYLGTAKADVARPEDYVFGAGVLLKFPGNEATASQYLEKAISLDTVKANQIIYVKSAATALENAGKYADAFTWYAKNTALKGDVTEFDYYKLTDLAYKSANYARTDSIAKLYVAAYPTKPQGFIYLVNAAKALDSTTTPGAAEIAIEKQNEFYRTDTAKYNASIYVNYYYLLTEYVEKQKNYAKGLEIAKKMNAVYPEGHQRHTESKAIVGQLENALKPRATTPSKTPAKSSPKQAPKKTTSATKSAVKKTATK